MQKGFLSLMGLSDTKEEFGWGITRRLIKLSCRHYILVDLVAIVASQQPTTRSKHSLLGMA
jgi:hypothetical protein